MRAVGRGDNVRHPHFGLGRVAEVLGSQAVVDFFGDRITVDKSSLQSDAEEPAKVRPSENTRDRILFRRAYEAINLGVVPPHPDQLLALSIGGDRLASRVRGWLAQASQLGLCKVVFGDYGSGKSHHLRVMEAAALKQGWVVSFVEFDPKQADPAKPHLVYRAITTGLRFPTRSDGTQSRSFFDLVGEVREHWDRVSGGQMFHESPWFEAAMVVLRFHSHNEEQQYIDGVGWLSGQVAQHSAIRHLAREAGARVHTPPSMPRTLESADVYVQHLVVLNEWCKALGYKGLLIILDEAEHVRSFNVNRRNRANNLFDLLARCAHKPLRHQAEPLRNEHGITLPAFWKRGPHFGLVVALTEGATFADPELPLREACVFLHEESDMVRLSPPTVADYDRWCRSFLEQFETHYPVESAALRGGTTVEALSSLLADEYSRQASTERTLRIWTKIATLVPSLALAKSVLPGDLLGDQLRVIARAAAGEVLPWEM